MGRNISGTGFERWQCILVLCVLITTTQVLSQCSVDEFLCPAGYCIDFDDVCNSVKDCVDAADEQGCEPMPECRSDYERCPGSRTSVCIHSSWRCDGFDDCGDNSDEDANWCQLAPCPDDMVKCTISGQCIPGRNLCDGSNDCQDGSGADEPLDFCTSTSFTCPANHFQCHNGLCVPEHWVCDDDDDCGDGSDEDSLDCSAVTCRPGYFRCKRNLVRRSVCLPNFCLCDNIVHCEDALDELPPTCEAPTGSCDVGYFKCANDMCIHETWACDFENDCGDSSDEHDQCVYPTCPPATDFTCANGKCVRRDFVCDGVDDCQDMSDEGSQICNEISMASCGYLRNNNHGEFNCDVVDGNTHGSVCTFSCSRPGYGLCPGMPYLWTCQDGTWSGPASPLCCDTQPPQMTCPNSIRVFAAPNVTLGVALWQIPQASDNSGETIVSNLIIGRNPGAYFDEGHHTIQYEASDRAGNSVTCSFTVTVVVNRCEPPTIKPNQMISCSKDDFIHGTTCKFVCVPGWCTDSLSSTTSCESTGASYSWVGEQPTCRAIHCPALSIPANGFLSQCTTQYDSTCTFVCNSGYNLQGSVHRECGLPQSGDSPCIGAWSGVETMCVANVRTDTEPPSLLCPPSVTVHADRNAFSAMASWVPPQDIVENTGEIIVPEQIRGQKLGEEFPEGVHYMEYSATDLAGNLATCFFTVTVIVNRCRDLSPSSPHQYMSCSNVQDNFVYGSQCTFMCANGFALEGSNSITCDNAGTAYDWTDIQPTCIDITKPTVRCPSSMTRYAQRNDVTAQVTWNTPQAVDNRGEIMIVGQTAGNPSGSMFPKGQHTIEYTASDVAGNSATCSFTITVIVHGCNALNATSNQQMRCTNNPYSSIYGSNCTFSCDQGWCLSGIPSVICELRGNDAEWTGLQPTCSAVQCPDLNPPHNGLTIGTCDAALGSSCTFACKSGYQMEGDSTRQCSLAPNGPVCLGRWIGRATVCRDTQPPSLTCPDSITKNTDRSATTSTVFWTPPQARISGEVVQATQVVGNPSGSEFHEGQHVVTYEVSDLSGNVEMCSFTVTVVVNRCGPLIPKPNQQMICRNAQDHFVFGSTCDFVCDSGLCSDGQSSLTCENMGTASAPVFIWDEDLPNCNVVRCPSLDPPLNGRPVGSCDNRPTHGSTCSFECKSGYQSLGSGSRRCSADGSSCVGAWSGNASVCHDIEKPSISCPESTARNIESSESTVVITWDPPQVSDNSGENIQAQLKTDKPSGTEFTKGNHMIKYEARDSSGNSATCSFFIVVIRPAITTCEPLMPTSNQRLSCTDNFDVGSTCSFDCDSGYCLDHSNPLSCQDVGDSNYNWNGEKPTCREVLCSPLAPPTNHAHIVSGDLVCTGSQCLISCDDGYTPISGDRVRNCRHVSGSSCNSAYWDGEQVQCQDSESPQFTNCPNSITIHAPKFSEMAYVTWDITAEDNSGDVEVTCDMEEGIMLEGVYDLKCTATDATGNRATCESTVTVAVRRCQPIQSELPQHASVNPSESCTEYNGGTCSIRCRDGFMVQGSRQAMCEYDSEQGRTYWSWNQPPTCVSDVSQCSSLPSEWLSSGVQHQCTQSYNIGSMCTFFCPLQGYTLHGAPVQLTCQAGGAWNTDVLSLAPRCDDTQPPTIDFCLAGPIQGELSPKTLHTEINFIMPQASDNSQQPPYVVTTPTGVTSPFSFAEHTWVTYEFYDESGNRAVCSFQIIVINNLPPRILSCPENMRFDSVNAVDWEIPRFENPLTQEPLTSLCNKYPTDVLSAGENRINCRATNSDNNVEGVCEFSITVGANSLPCPELPPITNGHWVCQQDTCTLTCNQGFDVPKHSTQRIYKCSNSGWFPPNPTMTKCTATRNPMGVAVVTNTTGSTTNDCTNAGSDIANTVKDAAQKATEETGQPCTRTCDIAEPMAECEKIGTDAGRSKRSSPHSKIMVCFKVRESDIQEVDIVEEIQKQRRFAMKIISRVSAALSIDKPPSVDLGEVDLQCEPGFAQAATTMACVPCLPNTYEAKGRCKRCPLGTYQPSEGMTWCTYYH